AHSNLVPTASRKSACGRNVEETLSLVDMLKMKLLKEKFNSKEFKDAHASYFDHRDLLLRLIENVYEYIPDDEKKIAGELNENVTNFIWTVRLLNLFKIQGKILKKPGKEGPDIIIQDGNKDILIECVVPQNWEAKNESTNYYNSYHEENKILKYTSSIHDKSKQYTKWIENRKVNNESPFIIAISGELQTMSDVHTGYPDIFKAVYPLGKSFYSVSLNDPVDYTISHDVRAFVTNKNIAEISTNTFLDDKMEQISGIIFNPYGYLQNSITDLNSYLVIENYKRKNNFPSDIIKGSKYYSVTEDYAIEIKHVD
ncbi:hypothetical protein DLM76_16340, partial [Leptospira yasudae]|uniref:hypothetical protein n=1 Tax=Leptospira yasudae TaxID=2202201 RepID=UPI000EDBD4DE